MKNNNEFKKYNECVWDPLNEINNRYETRLSRNTTNVIECVLMKSIIGMKQDYQELELMCVNTH